MKTRRIIIRISLVLVYVGLLLGLLFMGRGHTILLDNKADPAGTWKAFRFLEASFNGQKAVELAKNERAEVKLRGQSHQVEITLDDGRVITQAIELDLNDGIVVLSVPKLVAGIDPWLEPFVQPARVRAEPEPEMVPEPGLIDPLAIPTP